MSLVALRFKQNIVFNIIRIMDFAILIWPSQNSNRQANFIKFCPLGEEFFIRRDRQARRT